MSAAGSYDALPPVAILRAYLTDEAAREFVDGMMEVHVRRGEFIIRQGDKSSERYARNLVLGT